MRKRTFYSVLYVWLGLWTLHQTTFAQNAILSNPSACGLNLPIADNSCPDDGAFFRPNRFVIRVNNAPGAVLGQDAYLRQVRLILTHPWASDLDITLISPGGRQAMLTADNGGGEDNYGEYRPADCGDYTVFTMEACAPIADGAPPFTDVPFLPEESLYRFHDGTTNPNGDWILQICDDVEEDIGALQFVELVFAPLLCLPVSDLRIADIDSTTFILDWTPDPICETTVIEYGPPGFTPGAGQQAGQGVRRVTAACPPYRLTGLAPGATYDVYVRKFCALSSAYSVNSCAVTGTAGCLPPPATLVDDFDDEALCVASCGAVCPLNGRWKNATGDGFDWLTAEGSTATPGTGPSADASGDGRYLYLETSGQDCNENRFAQLNSHCIQLQKMGADTCHFSFNYHMYGAGIGALKLEASQNGGQTWQTLWSKKGNQGDRWHKTYLSLNRFPDGAVLQFRFTGTGSADAKGDMALDNIVFYGSTDLGDSPFIYYADNDGDGFGAAAAQIRSCLAAPPNGYVDNGLDCNDRNPNIHPDAAEIPCNQIDENCSGADDDPLLPVPRVSNDTICSGELAVVRASSTFGKPVFWYGSPTGNDFVGFGNAYFAQLPENDGPVPVKYRFYAEETDFTCRSERRAEAVIVVNPKPRPRVGQIPEICPGEILDLSSIEILDANFTGAEITYYTSATATSANRLSTTIVQPRKDTTFYFRLTTPEGCATQGRLDLKLKPAPTIAFFPSQDLEVCREDTATVRATAAGGAGGYDYFWSNGVFGPNLPVYGARLAGDRKVYQLTVTDAEGCSTRENVVVRTTTSIDSIRRIVQNVSTCLGTDGAITIVPLDGTGPYNYQWLGSNGVAGQAVGVADTLFLKNLAQGSYQLTVTDNSPEQCDFVTRQILVNGPAAVVEAVKVRHVSCFGARDGQICLDVQARNPTYRWSNGAKTPCLEGVAGGTYAVTLTEGDCETVIEGIEVQEPNLLRVVAAFDRPACHNSRDGAITLSTFGGAPPYQYRWGNGATQKDLTGLNGGTYSLTVTDANRCLLLTSVELSAPGEIRIQTDSIRPISCPGAKDGFIKVSAAGGTPPYRYEWNTGRTSALLPQAGPGTYTLSVTDLNGCVKTQTFTFNDPTPVRGSVLETTTPKCQGDNTGRIALAAAGGTPPYRFRWSTGARGPTVSGLGVGLYTVTITDANNCRGDTLRIDLRPRSPLSVVVNTVEPLCAGAANGVISLLPQGTAPFFYAWTQAPALNAARLDNVGVGDYAVRITDAEGCQLDTVVSISAKQVFDPQINTVEPRCAGSADGVIDVSFVAAGLPPFNYVWSNGSREGALVGVSAGDYRFTVTDVLGCTYRSDTIRLQEPAPLRSEILGLGPIVCQGQNTGFIEMAVQGGVAPYAYNWAGQGRQTKDLYNLTAGSYRLQVRDANNCPYDTTVVLREPRPLEAKVDLEIDKSCNAEFVSKLTAVAQGGVPPYRYRWNNGAESPVLTDLPSGDYELSVEDANGCVDEAPSIKVAQREIPIKLDTFFVTDITCRGANNGTMNARISGGSPPYRFHFSNNEILITSNTSASVGNLSVDNDYMVTVTDLSSGCVVVSEVKRIKEPPQLNLRRDSTLDVRCFGASTGAIYVSTSGGVQPYKMEWLNVDNLVVGTREDLVGVPAGRYIGLLVDANDCADTLRADIRALNPAIRRPADQINLQNILCKGDRTGAIDLTVTGGRPPYRFRWNNGAQTEDLRNIPAGAYTLTVTDNVNCQVVFPPLIIQEPEQALSIAGIVRNVRCKGFADGSVDIAPSGGAPPYQIEWTYKDKIFTLGATELDSLLAGTYFVKLTDHNGCQRSAAFGVAEPPLLSVRLLETDTDLQAIAAGGVGPYRYLWNTGEDEPVVDSPLPGTYSVTVIDDNGCRAKDSLVVVHTYDPEWIREVRLFPNPAEDDVYLEVTLNASLPLDVLLYDPWGRLLHRQEQPPARRQRITVPLREFPPGAYWLTLRGPTGAIFTGTVLKQ